MSDIQQMVGGEPDWPLEGPWEVRLTIPVGTDYGSPEEAAEAFIENIVEFGLRGYLYRVTNADSDGVWFVKDRQTYSLASALETFQGMDGTEGDDDLPYEDDDE